MLQGATGRPRVFAVAALLLLVSGVFVLPFSVPVQPAVSDSFATGFNNRVAVMVFVLGGLLFVAATDGLIAAPDSRNRRLPRWSLFVLLGCTLLACAVWRHHRWPMLGPEANYALERQFHLDQGQRIYRGFEYIYGPLLLYPGHWIREIFHVSTLAGYLISLAGQWLLGMAMLWFVVAFVDLPTRFRSLLLIFFFLVNLQNMYSDGVNYTPTRGFCATFLALVVFLGWRRFRNAWLTAACMLVAMSLGAALSPEQGISLIVGLTLYAGMLTWMERSAFPPMVAGVVVAGAAGIAAVAFHAGEFLSTVVSAAGGYNLPLLPSPVNVFLLATYLCGLGLLYRAFRQRQTGSATMPLALCGLPMLSAALGRCDTGHLAGATPLLVVSVFAIAGRPRLLAVWLPLACFFLLHLTPALSFLGKSARLVETVHAAQEIPAAPAEAIPPGPYFAPVVVPLDENRQPRWAADSGYYFGLTNAVLPRAIQAKADEIVRRRAPRLILPDQNGQLLLNFWASETDLQELRGLEGSFWVPRARNLLPSTAPVRNAIERMYRPTGQAQDGWRVWALR